MASVNRQHTSPVRVKRSVRKQPIVNLTSAPAGKFVPVAALPLLREDAVQSGVINCSIEMMETVELLMNPVHVKFSAYLVPWLAFDRFEGSMDQFNRSFMGEPQVNGGDVIPFFEDDAFADGTGKPYPFYQYVGLHHRKVGGTYLPANSMYLEAYNATWNWLAKNRSPDIEQRDRLSKTLAPAFWMGGRFDHIVPDFDQAVIDGEVPLNFTAQRVPIRGLGVVESGAAYNNVQAYEYRDPTDPLVGSKTTYPKGLIIRQEPVSEGTGVMGVKLNPGTLLPEIFAELSEAGVTISLSNIALAKKTQAFARIRQQYSELDEEWIIDMLMSGLHIPDQMWKQPMLLATSHTRVMQNKRYSTDADALDKSAVSGVASASLRLRVPQLHTGGVIIVVAECVPEQLFERQSDPLLSLRQSDKPTTVLPDYLRDYLDPEKVVAVTNGFVDTDHDVPEGLFGYAPLNHEWRTFGPRVGGKFYRPDIDAPEDEDRNRLWAVETPNPKLSENFYIVSDIHTKPFLHPDEDPFEMVVLGELNIVGNTVFGGALVENEDNYDKVMEKAPMDRIEKDA